MPTTKLLFTDFRHIQCGHLKWTTAGGEAYGVANPPGAPVALHAEPQQVPHGIRFEAQRAVKTGPVAEYCGWGRVIREGGVYRSWYLEINGHSKLGSGSAAHAGPPKSVLVCCVESTDGFQWRVTQRSPLVAPGLSGFDGLTFFVDPSAPAAERYKFVYCATFAEGLYDAEFAAYLARPALERDERVSVRRRGGIFAAVSPDGQQWQHVPRPLMFHLSDTDTTIVRDEGLGKYVMFTRMFRESQRWIGRAESLDFREWTPVQPVIWPRLDDPCDYDFYLNGYTRYPDYPQYQLMFPMVWRRFTERSEVRLYSSVDGLAWNQVPGGAVLEAGRAGDWDAEFIGTGKDLLPFGSERVAIPYTGTAYPHKYPRWPVVWDAWKMGWAYWPQDRLCALAADRIGEFWTLPVQPAGRTLRLNFSTPLAGEVRVGIAGVPGRSVDDCDPLVGDHAARTVTWRGQSDVGDTGDEPLALHFRLRCARLFAAEFV
jgi:hypothetical protein